MADDSTPKLGDAIRSGAMRTMGLVGGTGGLHRRGAESIVLGRTEIPLLIGSGNTEAPLCG